jgi:hypothetical protein
MISYFHLFPSIISYYYLNKFDLTQKIAWNTINKLDIKTNTKMYQILTWSNTYCTRSVEKD